MDHLIIRNLDDKILDQLIVMAKSHGRSLEDEVREILSGATLRASAAAESKLGSRIAARFRECGLDEPIRELRGRHCHT